VKRDALTMSLVEDILSQLGNLKKKWICKTTSSKKGWH
jgi:hypothetical protein